MNDATGEDPMQKITPFLWFDDQAEEAMHFYTSIFKNSKPGRVTRYGKGGPGPEGNVMSVTFELEGQQFMGLNGGPMFHFTEAISLFVDLRNPGRSRRALGKTFRRGREEPMRLAERQVRPFLADHSSSADAADAGSRPGKIKTRDAGDAEDEQNRNQGIAARLPGILKAASAD